MHVFRSFFVFPVLALLAAGCGGANPDPLPVDVRLDVRAGQTVVVGAEGLRITLHAVPSDSRCPMDAMCVWQGNAVARFELALGSRAETHELHTQDPEMSAEFSGYSMQMVALSPYPSSAGPIAPSDYVATIHVATR